MDPIYLYIDLFHACTLRQIRALVVIFTHLLSYQRQLVEPLEKQFQVGQKRLQVLALCVVVAQDGVEHAVEAAVLGVQLDRRRLVDGRVCNGRSGRVLRPLRVSAGVEVSMSVRIRVRVRVRLSLADGRICNGISVRVLRPLR